jgi:hypothetical protein
MPTLLYGRTTTRQDIKSGGSIMLEPVVKRVPQNYLQQASVDGAIIAKPSLANVRKHAADNHKIGVGPPAGSIGVASSSYNLPGFGPPSIQDLTFHRGKKKKKDTNVKLNVK